MSESTESDSPNVRSVKDVLSAFAATIAARLHEQAPDLDETTTAGLVDNALNDIVALGTGKLSRGEVFGLFAALGKLVGIPEPAISGPYAGTRKILMDEFEFMAFTPVGTAVFRHRKTGRDLYIAIHGQDLLIGMYEYGSGFSAFTKNEDALEWARGITGNRGMPKRKTSLAWNLP